MKRNDCKELKNILNGQAAALPSGVSVKGLYVKYEMWNYGYRLHEIRDVPDCLRKISEIKSRSVEVGKND